MQLSLVLKVGVLCVAEGALFPVRHVLRGRATVAGRDKAERVLSGDRRQAPRRAGGPRRRHRDRQSERRPVPECAVSRGPG